MADVEHKNITTPNLHDPGYNQSSDPGAVGAGQYWVDTSGGTGNWVLKVRNAANTGWETVASGGGGASGNTIYHVDVPPTSPSNYDDEFDDDSFDTTLWSEFDHGSLLTVTEGDHGAKLALSANSGLDYAGIEQDIQSGNFTYTAKIRVSLPKRNMYSHIGLVLFEGVTSTSNFFGIFLNTTRTDYNQRITILEMNDYQNFSTEDTYEARVYNDTFIYLRIRYDGTDYHFEWSMDGIGWRWLWSEDDALYSGNATSIGVVLNCEDSSVGMTGFVEWFRYTNSDVGNDGYIGGGELGAGGMTADGSIWSGDAPPDTPSDYDDEFDDESFDSSLWTDFDEPSSLTYSEEKYGLTFTGHSTSNYIQGIYQDVPASNGWSIMCKVSMIYKQHDDNKCGLMLLEDVDNLSTSDVLIFAATSGGAGTGVQVEKFNAYNSYLGNVGSMSTDKWLTTFYLRIRADSSNNWKFDWSNNGIGWYEKDDWYPSGSGQGRLWAPEGFGIFVRGNNTNCKWIVHWFRYSTNTGYDVVLGNRINFFNT